MARILLTHKWNKLLQLNTLTQWLEAHRLTCDMEVEEISWKESLEWRMDKGSLRHRSGGFFSIVGVSLDNPQGISSRQPLIDQPQIGILGYIVQQQEERLHVLIQAKPEPGNIGLIQAAPSVQATESNYKRLHKGKATPFLNYFIGAPQVVVHADTLQSEQGTRFLGKYNRNMIVELPGDTVLRPSAAYKWAPVDELCALLTMNFQVNTDARSVLVCAPWALLAPQGTPFDRWQGQGGLGEALLQSYEASPALHVSTDEEIVGRLSHLRNSFPFTTKVISLSYAEEWMSGRSPVLAGPGDSFDVRHFRVRTSEREVFCWDQPLIASNEEGLAVLLAQEVNGVLHFLFRCRAEIGFRECFQYGPSIQNSGAPPIMDGFVKEDEILEAALHSAEPLLSSLHSDEGGRFYRSVSRYSIMLLNSTEVLPSVSSTSWMNLRQIERLSQRKGFFSNEARSLVSMLLAYL